MKVVLGTTVRQLASTSSKLTPSLEADLERARELPSFDVAAAISARGTGKRGAVSGGNAGR